MPFEKTYKVTSLRHPDKVYTSTDEFWADCEPEITGAANANEAFRKNGRIISTSTTLDADGLSLTYVKTYFDEEAYNEHLAEHASEIAENLTVCTFTEI